MNYVLINNIKTESGRYDYKGLSITHIVAGTQVYSDTKNLALFATTEDVRTNGDIEVISESTYLALEKELVSTYSTVDESETEEINEIELLKAENAELKIAMAELAEQQMLADTETKLAMAELAEAMMGGAK